MRTQVAGHGLACTRIDNRAAKMADVKTGPTPNAPVLIGYNGLIRLSDTCIDRTHLDTGRAVTGLA